MKKSFIFAALLGTALSLNSAQVTGRLTTEPLTVPGLTNVSAVSLANDGTLLGYLTTGPAENLRGFTATGTNVTVLPLPSGYTDLQPWGVDSAGTIVGELDYASGFILRGTNFTIVDFPAEGVTETLLTGINDTGLITGTAFGEAGPFAFTLQETNFALVALPGASRSFAYDVNNRGVVVGQYRQGAGDTFGFWKRGTNAHVALQIPGADRTIAYGINNNDVIVGAYRRTNETTFHGFIYEAGIYTLLDVPNSTWTVPSDLNDDGVIVGYYRTADGNTLPFRAARPMPKVRYLATTFDVPGKPHTLAHGLNDRGEVVGQWYGPGFSEGGGFRRGMDNSFELFSPPAGYDGVSPQSLNHRGDIVGQAYPDGFLRKGTEGRAVTLADHSEVFLRAINASGVFGGSAVGDFGDVPVIARDGTNLTVLPLPDSVASGVLTITDSGVLGGYRLQSTVVDSTTNSFTSGYVHDGATTTTIRVSGSFYSSVDHISSRGEVFGNFLARTSGNALRAYVAEGDDFTEIDLVLDRPGARRPSITARNESGTLAGFYTLPDGSYHGFVAYREDARLTDVHSDIGFDFTVADGWNPHVHNHGTETEFKPWEAILVVNSGAKVKVPAGPGYEFLGQQGESVSILPQTYKEGLLYLGVGAEAIEPGTFQNDRFRLELKDMSGPGDFSLFLVDGFGKPTAFLNTRDGITSADAYDVMAGSHVHMNWGFTRPGTYTVTMQATGVLANGTTTTPGPRTYTFLVLEPQAPRLSIQTVTGSQLRISFPTEMGISYRLQRRASLENGSWADLGDPLVGTGAEGHWTVPSDNTTGFFRVRLDR
jgi:surface-anchored protein